MKKRGGFTLIEIMVVIGIMAMLAALLLGGLGAAKNKAKRTKVRNAVDQIATAWKAYYSDYRYFPDEGPGESFKLTEMNNDAVRILQGNYSGDAGTKWGKKNPRKTRYLDFHPRYTDQAGVTGYKDPWGNLYRISLDEAPYDSEVYGNERQALKRSVAVCSMGPDGMTGDPRTAADDICSWDKR